MGVGGPSVISEGQRHHFVVVAWLWSSPRMTTLLLRLPLLRVFLLYLFLLLRLVPLYRLLRLMCLFLLYLLRFLWVLLCRRRVISLTIHLLLPFLFSIYFRAPVPGSMDLRS